jgi:hypothetical protein
MRKTNEAPGSYLPVQTVPAIHHPSPIWGRSHRGAFRICSISDRGTQIFQNTDGRQYRPLGNLPRQWRPNALKQGMRCRSGRRSTVARLDVRAHLLVVWRHVLRFVKLPHLSRFSLRLAASLIWRSTRNTDAGTRSNAVRLTFTTIRS